MAAVVVDSCLAVKWVVVQDYTAEARDLLTQWNAAGDDLFAPGIFRAEVANALYKYVHRGPGKPKPETITLDEAKLLLTAVLGVIRVVPEDDALLERALDLAAAWNRPSAYDTLFAALAERQGCNLWTADDKFFNAVNGRCSWVRHVAGHTIAPPASP